MQRLVSFWARASSALLVCASGLMVTFAQAEPNPHIRPLPYPFSHVVSFASDVDMQRPWHGAAIHRVFNEELGLTISDSLWPQGSAFSSVFFLGTNTINRTPSGVGTQPVFALLLREWHRGNVDHFHGWQEDGVLQARSEIDPPLALSSARVSQELPPVHQTMSQQRAQNFRLYFSEQPPPDLTVVVHDQLGRSLSLAAMAQSRGENIQLEVGKFGWIIEVIIPAVESEQSNLAISLMQIKRIEIIAPSCAAGCNTKLVRVERDHFSRQTVMAQLPWLEQWNIRPALVTSHGGNTLIQNYGIKGKTLEIPRTADTFLADKSTVVTREALADRKESHAYHSDFLRKLSVLGVWSYFPAEGGHLFRPLSTGKLNAALPALSTSYNGLYNVPRSTVVASNSNEDAFSESLGKIAPEMPVEIRRKLYCGAACTSDQGDALSLLISQSIYLIEQNEKVRHFWYTHFGSGGSDFKPSSEQPVTPTVLLWMRRLANLVYDFDKSVSEQRRVWSPPANSWLRYQIMNAGIHNQVKIGGSGSDVEITPWQDPVTQNIVPDPLAGTRDLHGLTIYVADPAKATLRIAGQVVHSFTRNPPDLSGRGSVTIVDDNTPTSMIGPIALRERGEVEVQNGTFSDVTTAREHVSLSADNEGLASIVFKPWQLELWNTSHLQLAFRKRTASKDISATPKGALKIDLVMEDGGTVALVEGSQKADADPAASLWQFANATMDGQWQRLTSDVTRLNWPDVKLDENNWRRPPLPVGRVREIRVSVTEASPGEHFDIGDLLALRPSGNGEAPGGVKLVAGRVTLDGMTPVAHIPVEATTIGGAVTTAATDRDGYYFFPGRTRNERLSIKARIGDSTCSPLQGREMIVQKNDVELDIMLDRCQK
ncbi:MAG: hypothetical protein ACKVON_11690 [Beijerinckiaceae bacterium]